MGEGLQTSSSRRRPGPRRFPRGPGEAPPSASSAPYTINSRVADVEGLVKVLREEGCNVVGEVQDSEYGKFGWVLDPEGNKVELWQPPPGQ